VTGLSGIYISAGAIPVCPFFPSIARIWELKRGAATMNARTAISFLTVLILILSISATALAADELFGTWRLVSFQRTIADTGEKKDLFGKSPQGLIIYGRDGRMLVLMVGDKRPKPPDLAKVTDQERLDLFKTMLAYGGTYVFDGKTIKHQVEVSWNGNWTGTEQVRVVKFEGNRLIMSTMPSIGSLDGKLGSAVLTWERVK